MVAFNPTLLAALLVVGFMASCTNDDFAASGSNKAATKGTGNNGTGNDGDGDGDVDEYGSNTDEGSTNGGDAGGDLTTDSDLALAGKFRDRFNGEQALAASPVDIVFAMDTSGSMNTEKSYLQQHMAAFVQKFLEDAKNIDFHIYMIGSNFQFPNVDNAKVTHINQSVGSYNALSILQTYFSGGISGAPIVRADAMKHIVVITDDDARNVLAAAFKSFIQATPLLAGKTTFNGFIGLSKGAQNAWCSIMNVGSEYSTLGADPEIGGLIQDLCVSDWSQLMVNLANKIISFDRKNRFALSKPAEASASFEVKIGGLLIDSGDFTFDAKANSIVFAEGREPQDQVEIEVTYTVKK